MQVDLLSRSTYVEVKLKSGVVGVVLQDNILKNGDGCFDERCAVVKKRGGACPRWVFALFLSSYNLLNDVIYFCGASNFIWLFSFPATPLSVTPYPDSLAGRQGDVLRR